LLEEVHMKYSQIHQTVKTHDQLKKKLYRDIIQLFDEGDVNEFICLKKTKLFNHLGLGKSN
jgi:hypothetical protein